MKVTETLTQSGALVVEEGVRSLTEYVQHDKAYMDLEFQHNERILRISRADIEFLVKAYPHVRRQRARFHKLVGKNTITVRKEVK